MHTTRRAFVTLSGTGLALALAGCTTALGPGGGSADDHTHTDGGAIDIRIIGDIAPGATVTVVATHDDEPVADAQVFVKDGDGDRQLVGTTNARGRLDVTVPAEGEKAGELNVKVRKGEMEGEFESTEAEGAITVTIEGDIEPGETVTVVATHDGDPVADAQVFVGDSGGNRRAVGTTNGRGRLQITVPDSGDLNVKVRKGELEGEFESDHSDSLASN